jgi:hypothetical protein
MALTIGDAFRANAMLVTMTIKRFPLEVNDRVAAAAAETAGNAKRGSVRAVKNCLYTADAGWKNVSSELSLAYNLHRQATSEWGVSGGYRLLPNATWADYIAKVGAAQRKIDVARRKFEETYDADVATAMVALGQYAPTAYPTAKEAGARFTLSVDFTPIAAGGAPVGLPEGADEWLSDRYAKRTASNADEALDTVLERVKDYTTKLLANINEDKRFRSTSLTNITDMVPMLRAFEFTGDQRLTVLADGIESQLGGYDFKSIKKDGKGALPQVQAVLDIMGSWGTP